jgi:hypothetical protein
MDSARGLAAVFDLRLETAVTCALDRTGCADATWRYLDALGNGDGVLNLGDFLAYLDRTSQQVTADVMTAVRSGLASPKDSSVRTKSGSRKENRR